VSAQSFAKRESDTASARQCVIIIPITVLPHANVVCRISMLGASLPPSAIARSVVGNRSCEGTEEVSHAFCAVFRVEMSGRKVESECGQVAVVKGMPKSLGVLYVRWMRW